ncbi:uncharacterized protein [Diadema setosum]|uniref:uncharacterized protein n=1 Tax=Diadema setosum TaxID=31175 RepID=UPI003B3B7049
MHREKEIEAVRCMGQQYVNKTALAEKFTRKNGIYYSALCDIHLEDFIILKTKYCSSHHCQPCSRCSAILKIGQMVHDSGIISLKELYCATTSAVYKTDKALRLCMQLPLVAFAVGQKKVMYVAEHCSNFDYQKMITHLRTMPSEKIHLSKEDMKQICSMASSETDQALIKYVAMKAQNLNVTQSRRELGVQNPQKLVQTVEGAISQQEQIRDALWDLAFIQASSGEKASLSNAEGDSTSSESELQDSDSEMELSHSTTASSERSTVHTDSESDDPDDYVGVSSVSTQKAKDKVRKLSSIIFRRTQRSIAKKIAHSSLLKRRRPKAVSRILRKYPNIGKVMEEYVHANLVGADAWRRTGVYTFDGNLRRGKRVTYKRIWEHLQDYYGTKFSYGSVVQLCVTHNKRRISSKRYKGVAQITSRRARKGWNVRLNPDHHYSNAFYKDLDHLQLKDGTNKFILNRDDAAGYRLDTTYTHKQYKNVSLTDQAELTTRTDYVNKYKSVLQTSMHLIMETDTTSQKVLGVVKAHHIFPKNPAQHMADLYMMSEMEEYRDDLLKPIDCIRVDGAADEGPSHLEVQYMWSEWHLSMGKYCTLVTARYAGGSYLNKVEQINGCLTRAHSNMFIPSTIHGSNFGKDGLDEAKLEQNLRTATDVYINRCDGAPAGRSEIKLVEGSRDDRAQEFQERRPSLLVFLKGSKTAREQLKREKPDLYNHFKQVWDMRNRHMQGGLPSAYVFQLLPCFETSCPHPVCSTERRDMVWYDGGPSVAFIPLPVPDPGQPWGGNCTTCSGDCSGHYIHYPNNMNGSPCQPPRDVLEEAFKTLRRPSGEVNEEDILDLARQTLLPVREVQMWLEHLESMKQRRLAGLIRARATRASKNSRNDGETSDVNENPEYDDGGEEDFCICHRGEFGRMIMCDMVTCSQRWFHYSCVGIRRKPRGTWYCPVCREK